MMPPQISRETSETAMLLPTLLATLVLDPCEILCGITTLATRCGDNTEPDCAMVVARGEHWRLMDDTFPTGDGAENTLSTTGVVCMIALHS